MYLQTPFRIGHIRIEPLECAVYPDNGPKQSLQPKFIDVLSYLASQYPNVVSRQKLIEHIWQGNAYVGEKALTNAVWHLRHVLDQPEQPEIIETIRKSGYRLLIEPQMTAAKKHRLSKKVVLSGVIILLVIISSLFYFTPAPQSSPNTIESVTTEPGLELFPAPSPDGRYLVYKWLSPDGQIDLYQRDMMQPQLAALRLTFDKASEGRPLWGRDGKKLYFRRKDKKYCDIVWMDMQSLQEHFIAKCPMIGALHYMDIAPDNKTLAYWG
ncbi:MAG: winged helix-turn-helix domain-containing protein [Paraglaciecola sp.]|nr:winged helix-turn-helix domain-containing protein [Paraglaciecola sp.]